MAKHNLHHLTDLFQDVEQKIYELDVFMSHTDIIKHKLIDAWGKVLKEIETLSRVH